jgi:hypothetical protein
MGSFMTLSPGNRVRIGAEDLMTANLGRWELRTSPARRAEGRAPEYQIVRTSAHATSGEPDLQETVDDFITRQVLEKDSAFFGG